MDDPSETTAVPATEALARRKLPDDQRRRRRDRHDSPRHSIASAARHAGVHPQTLRVYEQRGLIRPARTEGGKRLFSDAEIDRARRIRQVTEDNIPLVAARRVLRLEDLLHTAIAHIQTLEAQNRRLSSRLRALELAR